MKYLLKEGSKVYHLLRYAHSSFCQCGVWAFFGAGNKVEDEPPKDRRLCKTCEKVMESEFLKNV
jgi:hypothetical protein